MQASRPHQCNERLYSSAYPTSCCVRPHGSTLLITSGLGIYNSYSASRQCPKHPVAAMAAHSRVTTSSCALTGSHQLPDELITTSRKACGHGWHGCNHVLCTRPLCALNHTPCTVMPEGRSNHLQEYSPTCSPTCPCPCPTLSRKAARLVWR